MLTIPQKLALCELLKDEIERDPSNKKFWLPVLADVAADLRRHRTAKQLANQRNRNKKSRRDQRGPNI